VSRNNDQIPFYAPDGSSLGFRTREAAERLLAGGYVKPSYGRKGHLKAIHIRCEDGTSPVEPEYPSGTHYSYRQQLDSGRRCWKLKRLRLTDEDGVPFSTEGLFQQVLRDCLQS
jgi:hypothetical protein